MKTIYLRAQILQSLIQDIAKVIDDYSGALEDEKNGLCVYNIGDIVDVPAILNEDLSIKIPAVMIGAYHANLLVPEGFDASIFKTQIQKPKSPVHQFA